MYLFLVLYNASDMMLKTPETLRPGQASAQFLMRPQKVK